VLAMIGGISQLHQPHEVGCIGNVGPGMGIVVLWEEVYEEYKM
jgi:hypothetical protein